VVCNVLHRILYWLAFAFLDPILLPELQKCIVFLQIGSN